MTVAADNTGAGREIDTRVALLPIALEGERLRVRKASPKIGADTIEILQSAGYTQQEIEDLQRAGVIGAQPEAQLDTP
jgi:crotonobetainyl-CoA:carnitine CoA-transferase CaiB-like acyl-CoA transferase